MTRPRADILDDVRRKEVSNLNPSEQPATLK